MKKLQAVRSKNFLFLILSLCISMTFVTTWLPLLRCVFDGTSYRWGTGYYGLSFASRGFSTDYIVLIVFFFLYLALFASFYWVKKRIFFYLLLAWWWFHSFGNLLYYIVRNGDTMFHGDTLNIHISISKIVIPISILALILIIFVIIKDKKLAEVKIAWKRYNRIMALAVLLPISIQGVLFWIGEPHGLTDKIGVFIALLQCFAFPFIFIPSENKNLKLNS
ncbi:hypothetical protein [Aquimarina sp. 2201CG5-10]|uniref:hypothetical protein n=1 Tax=Aquimarina callyspongiae TaxID=3098150 RepID=UPI002AB4DBD3|nr:hypothetical protein [Aquimarina sp. 2201CG5-10]MDY8135875.1 hypothetical protein [Aquimarina sp. 2201CG5-10]